LKKRKNRNAEGESGLDRGSAGKREKHFTGPKVNAPRKNGKKKKGDHAKKASRHRTEDAAFPDPRKRKVTTVTRRQLLGDN